MCKNTSEKLVKSCGLGNIRVNFVAITVINIVHLSLSLQSGLSISPKCFRIILNIGSNRLLKIMA